MSARLRRRVDGDEGAALVLVLGTMVILTMFALTSLGLVMGAMKPTRVDQDSKRAFAAAQAGVDDFIARSNSNDTYYKNVATDTSNLAIAPTPAAPRGATVPGSRVNDQTFRYRMLSSVTEVAQTGTIRLEVTGYATNKSDVVSRKVIANLRPDSFLNYIYVTNYEVQDPELYANRLGLFYATLNNQLYLFYANPYQVKTQCQDYYYGNRKNARWRVNPTNPNTSLWRVPANSNGTPIAGVNPSEYTGGSFSGNVYDFNCQEIQWTGGDIVQGPLHSNDALQINGAVRFQDIKTETSWNTNPANGHLWWGGYTNDLPDNQPVYEAPLVMPSDNSELQTVATTSDGCTYSGATRITLVGNKMQVWSPGTTVAAANANGATCLSSNRTDLLNVPKVIFVKDRATSCSPGVVNGTTGVGFPLTALGENPTYGRDNPDFSCDKGDVYVQGTFSGATTIAASHDVVITGDIRYASGVTGTDVLGLIANRNAWVYHPVDGSGENLSGFTPVYNINAAILTLQNSFLVQNYDLGDNLSPTNAVATKLNVVGSIAQQFRGPVGTGGSPGTGYLKNYVWDSRLPANPPPFFIKPVSSPWYLEKLTDS